MLDQMTPGEFEERMTEERLQPSECVVETLSAGFAAVINEVRRQMAGAEWKESYAIPLDAFVPKVVKEQERPQATTDSFLETMKKRAGF